MPKLLQINITANWGSTGKIAENIGLAAMNHGWESYIAYGRWSNPSQSNLIKVGCKWNKYLHYAEQRIRDNEGLCSRSATRRLILQIIKIQPDVVQLHNIHDHYLNYKILFEYLNQLNIPVVWTFHDCWAFTGHCFHFVTKNCMRWKTGCYNCPLKNEYPKTYLDRSSENYDLKKKIFSECKNLTIVSVSEWMENFVKQSFLKDKQIVVIHNGVDLNNFKLTSHAKKKEAKFHIIAVSSVWNKDKGLNDIFKLREMMSNEYEFTIVGLSTEQLKHLPAGIRGIQRTQNIQELVALYNEADVLINPTYADTFPTVNLEALACGIPIITYRTGGSPEAIDFRTGIVVDQGDLLKMKNALIWMRANPFNAKDCRKRAEQYFGRNECFEKYIKLYEELIRK